MQIPAELQKVETDVETKAKADAATLIADAKAVEVKAKTLWESHGKLIVGVITFIVTLSLAVWGLSKK